MRNKLEIPTDLPLLHLRLAGLPVRRMTAKGDRMFTQYTYIVLNANELGDIEGLYSNTRITAFERLPNANYKIVKGKKEFSSIGVQVSAEIGKHPVTDEDVIYLRPVVELNATKLAIVDKFDKALDSVLESELMASLNAPVFNDGAGSTDEEE